MRLRAALQAALLAVKDPKVLSPIGEEGRRLSRNSQDVDEEVHGFVVEPALDVSAAEFGPRRAVFRISGQSLFMPVDQFALTLPPRPRFALAA